MASGTFHRGVSRLFASAEAAGTPRKANRSRSRRLLLEPLEDRCLLATISGYVYDDSANNSGVKQASDPGIAGCIVNLTGTDNQGGWVTSACETNAHGEYGFTNVNAGLYTLTLTPPAGYLDGTDTLGTAGGKVGNEQFSAINLAATTTASGYNFAELRPASLAGCVWDDTDNNDGIMEPGEPAIAGSNVMLIGTDDRGEAVNLAVITDSQAAYSFTNLRPGTYTITDDMPVGYTNGKQAIGTQGGTVGPDNFSSIVLAAGDTGTDYDFGKLMNYAVSPAVDFTLVLVKPDGVLAPASAAGEYQLLPGNSYTIEVYATDIREGVGAAGGVASAYVDLFCNPAYINITPGSLGIAPAFDGATSGSLDVAAGRVFAAGGSNEGLANGQPTPGAGTPQLLFSVTAQVPITAGNTTLASLRLLPAGGSDLATTVFGMNTAAICNYQSLTAQVGSPWRNAPNPWDVNHDGVVNTLDEEAILDALADGGPRVLPATVPPGAPSVDVLGLGVLNWLDALAIQAYLASSTAMSPQVAAGSPTPATEMPVILAPATSTPAASIVPATGSVDQVAALMAIWQRQTQTTNDQALATTSFDWDTLETPEGANPAC